MTGTLIATSNINEAINYYNNGVKVLFLGDPLSNDPNSGFMAAGPLVPDYNVLSLDINGDVNGFTQQYAIQLNQPSAIEFFAAIVGAVFRGFNICLYFPQDAIGLSYVDFLLKYIESVYGITSMTKTTQFMYNDSFNSKNLYMLYMNNIISSQEYIMYGDIMDEIILQKLINDLQLINIIEDPNSYESCLNWINNYRNQMQSAGQVLYIALNYDKSKKKE